MSRHQGVLVLSFKFAVFGKPVFSQLASFTTHFALSKIDRVTTVYMQEVVDMAVRVGWIGWVGGLAKVFMILSLSGRSLDK